MAIDKIRGHVLIKTASNRDHGPTSSSVSRCPLRHGILCVKNARHTAERWIHCLSIRKCQKHMSAISIRQGVFLVGYTYSARIDQCVEAVCADVHLSSTAPAIHAHGAATGW